MTASEEPLSPAAQAFAEYLERGTHGRAAFDAFCAERPELADKLRRMHAEWGAFQSVLSGSAGEPEPPATPLSYTGHERYEIREEIARGGMGAILRVWDRNLRRELAMKVLLREGPVDSAGLMRFVEEAQITGQLEHPGIVPIHDVGLDADRRVYFTMPLVRGRDLREIYDLVHGASAEWTTTRALHVLHRICQALASAHAKGVVHRDLKPSNVMVGEYGETYVMDWGLARVRGRSRGAAQHSAIVRPKVETVRSELAEDTPDSPILTQAGDVVGTPAYMPPEQARGEVEDLDATADVYAVGAMLYHLLAGRAPYSDPARPASQASILARVLDGPPDSLDALAPETPAELVAVCEKAMARDRARRYGDIGEMADDLRAYLEGRVVQAYETGALAQLKKWVGRNRGLAGALAGGAGLVLLVSGVSAVVLARKNEELGRTNTGLSEANASLATKTREEEESRQLAEDRLAVAEEINAFLNEDLLSAVAPSDQEGRGWDVGMREVLDAAADRIGDRFHGEPLVEASVRATLGRTYLSLGEYGRAEPHLERAVALHDSTPGVAPTDTVAVVTWYADLYKETDRFDDAERLYREALDRSRESLGAAHRATVTAINNLAVLLDDVGRFEEAVPLHEASVEYAREAYGPDDPGTQMLVANLARSLVDLGRYDEAERHLVDALSVLRRVAGERNPDTLFALRSLALLRDRQGLYEEAAHLHRECVDEMRVVFGPQHAETLVAVTNHAVHTWRRGDYAEAERLLVEHLPVLREVLGSSNDSTLDALHSLGRVYEAQGRHAEAEPLLVECLEGFRATLGDDDPDTLVALGGLASIYLRQRRFREAEPLFLECVERSRRILGPGHRDTLASLGNLAALYRSQGRYAEAEPLFVECLAAWRAAYGDAHPDTLVSMRGLARLYRLRGDYARAVLLYVECLAGRREVLGEEHPETLTTMGALARTYMEQGRHDEAEPLYLECLEKRRSVLGEANASTLWSLCHVAEIHRVQGRLDEAEPAAREALAGLRAARGEGHEVALVAQRVLGSVLRDRGQGEEAEELLVSAFERMRESLGEGHGSTLRTQEELARLRLASGQLDEARRLAADVLERTPEGAPRRRQREELLGAARER